MQFETLCSCRLWIVGFCQYSKANSFLSPSWLTHQQEHFNTYHRGRIASLWASRFIHQPCNVSFALWDHRNKIVHGSTADECCRKKLETLRRDCQTLATRVPAVGAADEHLLEVNLEDKGRMYLHVSWYGTGRFFVR